MDGRAPISRVEHAPSYLASHEVPAWWGTIRGATAPTAGSAKCGSSRSSQPGAGTQSESRNATKSVDAAARPELRAAPGPPFTGRWITRAPYAAAMAAIAWGSAEASSTTITCGLHDGPGARTAGAHDTPGAWTARARDTSGARTVALSRFLLLSGASRPPRQRASSACRSRTGITTVTSWMPRACPSAALAAPALAGPTCPVAVLTDPVLTDPVLTSPVLTSPVLTGQSGLATPASSKRRASARGASPPPTGAPENQPATWRAPVG